MLFAAGVMWAVSVCRSNRTSSFFQENVWKNLNSNTSLHQAQLELMELSEKQITPRRQSFTFMVEIWMMGDVPKAFQKFVSEAECIKRYTSSKKQPNFLHLLGLWICQRHFRRYSNVDLFRKRTKPMTQGFPGCLQMGDQMDQRIDRQWLCSIGHLKGCSEEKIHPTSICQRLLQSSIFPFNSEERKTS